MARLPLAGGDQGTWGDVLNDFLLQAHNGDGTIKAGAVDSTSIDNGSITLAHLDTSNAPTANQVLAYDGSELTWVSAAVPPVISVNGQTGAVTLTKSDVGLGNVDNTSDANKPLSTATTTALSGKLSASSNLSDLANTSTARTNLGLGTAATLNVGTTAGTVAAGDDSRLSNERTPVDLSVTTAKLSTALQDEIKAFELKRILTGNVSPTIRAFLPLSEDPPTVSVSAHNGATIVSSPVAYTIHSSPTKVRIESAPNYAIIPTDYVAYVVADEFMSWSLRYVTDSLYHEITYQASASPSFRLWVDNRRVTSGMINLTNGGGGAYRLRITFPDRRLRSIRLETVSLFPSTITVSATDTLYAEARPRIVAAFMGDSITQQNQPDNWAGTCARLLGWEPLFNASGGTGYLATSGSHQAFSSRLNSMLSGLPDVVVFAGGINDSGAGLQAAAASLFAQTRVTLPNSMIIALGPWAPSSGSAISQASKGASIAAAIATVSNAYYIDNLTDPWITGNGTTAAPSGTGNADIYIGADGTHPNADGSYYLGARVAQAITNLFPVLT